MSQVWVFVQPASMMNTVIRKDEKSAVFVITESLPVMRESKCTGYINIPIPLMETDKYINMEISGTSWKILSMAQLFHSGRTDWVE